MHGKAGPLRGEAHCGHAVQLYRYERELAGPVASYLSEGLAGGEPGVVVATAEHRRLFVEELERLGWNPRTLEAIGLLTYADAEGTLAGFLEDAGPSRERFNTVIGRLLDRVSARRQGRPVRVFGEMVDLLSRRGHLDAALAVEALWEELGRRRTFSLLCAYRLDVFDAAAQRTAIPSVCRAHDHIAAGGDSEHLEHAVDRALAETLGPDEAERVRRLAVEARRDGHIPPSQLALMWVSARMPALAEPILAAARAAYDAPVLAPSR